jgi:hypothetical protein
MLSKRDPPSKRGGFLFSHGGPSLTGIQCGHHHIIKIRIQCWYHHIIKIAVRQSVAKCRNVGLSGDYLIIWKTE